MSIFSHRFLINRVNGKVKGSSPALSLIGGKVFACSVAVSTLSNLKVSGQGREEGEKMELHVLPLISQNAALTASLGIVTWAFFMMVTRIMTSLNRECTGNASELAFEDPDRPVRIPVPSIHAEPAKTLTVVFPAYNESTRLSAAVDEAIEYLNLKRKRDSKFSYEIIIVDDGSTDETYAKAMKYVQRYGLDTVKVLRLPVNKGKGAAVRAGILAGRGETLLFADSDGATQFSEVDRLHSKLVTVAVNQDGGPHESSLFNTIAKSHGMVFGSRAHLENTEAVAKRHWFRNLLMHGFHFLVLLVAGQGVKDSQCGFKVCPEWSCKSTSTIRVKLENVPESQLSRQIENAQSSRCADVYKAHSSSSVLQHAIAKMVL